MMIQPSKPSFLLRNNFQYKFVDVFQGMGCQVVSPFYIMIDYSHIMIDYWNKVFFLQ